MYSVGTTLKQKLDKSSLLQCSELIQTVHRSSALPVKLCSQSQEQLDSNQHHLITATDWSIHCKNHDNTTYC